jgi:hypothetical protein
MVGGVAARMRCPHCHTPTFRKWSVSTHRHSFIHSFNNSPGCQVSPVDGAPLPMPQHSGSELHWIQYSPSSHSCSCSSWRLAKPLPPSTLTGAASVAAVASVAGTGLNVRVAAALAADAVWWVGVGRASCSFLRPLLPDPPAADTKRSMQNSCSAPWCCYMDAAAAGLIEVSCSACAACYTWRMNARRVDSMHTWRALPDVLRTHFFAFKVCCCFYQTFQIRPSSFCAHTSQCMCAGLCGLPLGGSQNTAPSWLME